MPITRRRRINPPDQPENNNHSADQSEAAANMLAQESQSANGILATSEPEHIDTDVTVESSDSMREAASAPENTGNTVVPENTLTVMPASPAPLPPTNSERTERQEMNGSPLHPSQIEGGKRTARGELFRRPPLPPVAPAVTPAPAPTLQPPSHEVSLPLGKKPGDTHGDPLHLAYNPGYTGADEVRNALLHKLAQESRAGGRGRCWGCGAISIVYDRWNTRSKSLGEIGIAYCEICGVWSVM